MKIIILSDSILFRNILRDCFSNFSDIKVYPESKQYSKILSLIESMNPDFCIIDSESVEEVVLKILPCFKVFLSPNTSKPIEISSNHYQFPKPNLLDLNEKSKAETFSASILNLFKDKGKQASFSSDLSQKPSTGTYRMLLIGASTGGPPAVATVLKGIGKDFPLGFVVIQHIETGFDEGYARWLQMESGIPIRLAKDGDRPGPGEGLLAPTDKHLIFRENRLYLDDGPRVLNQKPSVDVTFESASDAFGSELIAVLLTGMGTDGANGCVRVKANGGITIVQNKETSLIYGMPKAAIEKNGATYISGLDEISDLIKKLVK